MTPESQRNAANDSSTPSDPASPPPRPAPGEARGERHCRGALLALVCGPLLLVSACEAPGAEEGLGQTAETASAPSPSETAAASSGPETAERPGSAAAPVGPSSSPESWPMWGGDPSRNMVNSHSRGIPHTWDIGSGKNIKWFADLGSQSYGNPTILDGKILVGTNNQSERNPDIKGDKGVVMCFRESDGRFLWQAVHDKLPSGRVNDWPEQGVCSSPALEGGKLYYVSNRAELICADMEGFLDGENDGPFGDEKYKSEIDGDFIWVFDMIEELGVFPHNLATSSPVIVGDIVYVVTSNGVEKDHITIPSPRSPSFIAVNKRTGELIWEDGRPADKILHGQWSSACHGVVGGRAQIVYPGGDGWLRSLDPADGALLWEFDCNPKDSVWELGGRGTRNNLIATPVFVNGRILIGVGQDPEHGESIGHLYSIDASKSGDVTESGRVWHVGGEDFSRTMSTVAVKDGLVYAADLTGYLYCFDEETGKQYWKYDMYAAVWGSPTWIDGKIFLGDEDGDVAVFEAGKTLKKLSEINMGNSVYSTAVAANGVLYIANRKRLFAIAEGS